MKTGFDKIVDGWDEDMVTRRMEKVDRSIESYTAEWHALNRRLEEIDLENLAYYSVGDTALEVDALLEDIDYELLEEEGAIDRSGMDDTSPEYHALLGLP